MGTVCDIAGRQRRDDAFREGPQLLEQVLATLPVGVAVIDRAGDIQLANEAFKRTWGWSEGPIVSGNERWERSKGFWHESGERIAPSEWPSARAVSTGQTTTNRIIDIETSRGERKTIENSTAPIRDAEHRIVGAVIVNQDVTELVRAEQALQQCAEHLQQLSLRLLTVREEERTRLSRELHDECGQLLAAMTLHLQVAKELAGRRAGASLRECMALVQQAGVHVRNMALELHPRMLETAGIDATLRWLAEQHQHRTGTPTRVVGRLPPMGAEQAMACFRVAQEALTNIARHARARHVSIELARKVGFASLTIRDDGAGFDVAAAFARSAEGGALGLSGMKERVEILHGRLEIHSEAGRGTVIHLSLPVVTTPLAGPAEHKA